MAAIEGESASVKKAAYVRQATKRDVPVVKRLIEGLAQFEKLTDQCEATEAKLDATLFPQPTCLGPTVLLLELGPPKQTSSPTAPAGEGFQEQVQEVSISGGVHDAAAASFVSTEDAARTVVAFVLFSRSYSTLLANSGLTIGDFFVREEYRRQGLGKLLLGTVAQYAAQRQMGRVEWSVLDWNVNALKFYEAMGAVVMHDWRTCRLAGDALQAYYAAA